MLYYIRIAVESLKSYRCEAGFLFVEPTTNRAHAASIIGAFISCRKFAATLLQRITGRTSKRGNKSIIEIIQPAK